MRKRAVSLALCLCMVLSLLPLPTLAVGKHPFTDVAETVWFNDSVAYVYEHNLMKGTSDTTFEPYRATQRGMIVTILHRLEGTPAVSSENPFADVPKGSNYENAIIWAANNGIVNGYDNSTFGPYENITRQQMAAILYRYAQMKGYRISTSANLSEYEDSSQIGDYARTAMAWANGEGLINGNSSKQLMPTGTATRAQVAAILTRFCQNVVPQQTPPVSPPIEEPPQTTPAPVDPINYTVTFDLNYDDAGVYQTLSVSKGEKVTKPKNPTREKYSFLDWYTTATTGGQKFNFKSAINSDITLYARWSRKSDSSGGGGGSYTPPVITSTYAVIFDSNDGSPVNSQSVTSGNAAIRPADPTRTGYLFRGWYTDGELTDDYDFSDPVTSNITLYAKWIPETLTVEFNSDSTSQVESQIVRLGEYVLEPEEPEKDGYTFMGWTDTDGFRYEFDEAIDEDTIVAGSLLLTADWVETADVAEDVLEALIEVNTDIEGEATETFSGEPLNSVDVQYTLDNFGVVNVKKVRSNPMLLTAGLIGSPVEINAFGGDVKEATITFHYDPAQMGENDPNDLVIVWYDDENDVMTVLENSVVDTEAHTVQATTNHFSTYGITIRQVWDEFWNTQLPTVRTADTPYYNVVIAIDCSGSMQGNKMEKSIEAAQNLIDALTDDDYVTILSFTTSTNVVLGHIKLGDTSDAGDNRQVVKDAIGGLRASGGTNIENVLQRSAEYVSGDSQYQSFIILISDGQSSVSPQILQRLKSNNQRVVAVGIGNDVDRNLMQRIADGTDGSYLYCANATDLKDAFIELQNIYIGSTQDTDGDGLPDLVETTGMRDQYGNIWKTDPNNADSDNDGYSDGEEMGTYHPLASHPYFARVSRPDLYTVKSDEACLMMADNLTYGFNTDDNEMTLVAYIIASGYEMVPDLITPMEPDGIPKEYIYSAPRNLQVTITQLPAAFTLEEMNTVQTEEYGYSTFYEATARISFSRTAVLDSVTWNVTAENCSEQSGVYSGGIKANYVQQTQPVQMNEHKVTSEQAEYAGIELARTAKDLIEKMQNNFNTKNSSSESDTNEELRQKRERVKQQFEAGGVTLPNEVYEAIAMAILQTMDASKLEEFKEKPNKMAEQIKGQIQGGLINLHTVVKVKTVDYSIDGPIWTLYGLGVSMLTVTWRENGRSQKADVNWQNVFNKNGRFSTEGINALSDYCAALAQLNTDVWKDFLAYYTSDVFTLLEIKSVTKDNIRTVLDYAEKGIKALYDKKAANELVEEMNEAAKNALKSGLTNKFKKYVKENIPNGETIVKAAEGYKAAKEKYESFQQKFQQYANEWDNYKKADKAEKAYLELQTAYRVFENTVNSL